MDSNQLEQPSEVLDVKQNKSGNPFLLGLLVGIFVMSLVGTVLFVILGQQNREANKNKQQMAEKYDMVYLDKEGTITPQVLQKLQNVLDLIHNRYYLSEMDDEQLLDGMYEGIMESLGDPYSEYYKVAELQEMLGNTAGTYYGIGAYVSIDPDTNMTKISGIIEGTPAEEAGLRANDIIYLIDGESTYGISLNEAVALIKGDEGTTTLLTIIRDGETMEVPVVRRKVESPTVNSEMFEDGMGYLQITEFDDVTPGQFRTALERLREQDMKGLILDLRANPGGTLDGVVDIAGQILPEGIIVYTEDKLGNRMDYKSDGHSEIDIPMVVLVDMNTASAAEILSGAIQDYGKGTLVGTTTFGKGIVQSVISLQDDTAVKLTVSAYFTPNGRNIHKTGIKPDIICEFDSEAYYGEEAFDNQLDKAKEVLADMMK